MRHEIRPLGHPTPPAGALGDCILHRAHHPMAGECWRAVLNWSTAHGSDPDAYKAAYERAVLNDLKQGADHA